MITYEEFLAELKLAPSEMASVMYDLYKLQYREEVNTREEDKPDGGYECS